MRSRPRAKESFAVTAILGTLLTCVVALAACSDERCSAADEGKCGIIKNQVLVSFKAGTTRERVDAINAEIGAMVVQAPTLTTIYVMRLPDGWCYQRGIDFYAAKVEVQTATVAVNVCGMSEGDASDSHSGD